MQYYYCIIFITDAQRQRPQSVIPCEFHAGALTAEPFWPHQQQSQDIK